MTWDVEYTDTFQAWWEGLREGERESVDTTICMLVKRGPALPYPYSSKVVRSRLGNLRELRIQHRGRPFRVLSIRAALQSSSWEATKPVMTAGMNGMCRGQKFCIGCISCS